MLLVVEKKIYKMYNLVICLKELVYDGKYLWYNLKIGKWRMIFLLVRKYLMVGIFYFIKELVFDKRNWCIWNNRVILNLFLDLLVVKFFVFIEFWYLLYVLLVRNLLLLLFLVRKNKNCYFYNKNNKKIVL